MFRAAYQTVNWQAHYHTLKNYIRNTIDDIDMHMVRYNSGSLWTDMWDSLPFVEHFFDAFRGFPSSPTLASALAFTTNIAWNLSSDSKLQLILYSNCYKFFTVIAHGL